MPSAVPGHRFPAQQTQPLHDAPDAGNVVVLADDEGAEHLKEGLVQHPQSRGGRHTGSQPFAGGKAVLDGCVIGVQGKIMMPEAIRLRGAEQAELPRVIHPGGDRTPGGNAVPAVLLFFPAKTLSAGQRLIQVHSPCAADAVPYGCGAWFHLSGLPAAGERCGPPGKNSCPYYSMF